MERKEIKARQDYLLKGTPAMGSFPAVPPEKVRVTGFSKIHTGEEWCIVRTEENRRFCVHPSNLMKSN